MDVIPAQNGADNGRVYVKFGPHPTDEMPIEWAQIMLTNLKASDPNRFGKLLTQALNGAK